MVFESCHDRLVTSLATSLARQARVNDVCVDEILGDVATLMYRHYALLLACHSARGPRWWVRLTDYLLRSWRYRRANRYTRGNPVVSAIAAVMLARGICQMLVWGRIKVGDVEKILEDTAIAASLAEAAANKLSLLVGVRCSSRRHAVGDIMDGNSLGSVTSGGRYASKYGSIVRLEPSLARSRLELLNKMLILVDFIASELSDVVALPARRGYEDVGVASSLEDVDRIVLDEAWMLASRYTRALLVNAGFNVYEGSAKCRIRVFLDKSGSMQGAPLTVGAAYALALFRVGEVEGFVFDTGLRRLDDNEIFDAFLTVRADGGTVIDNALREAARRDEPAVVVTDGIDLPSTKPSSNTLLVIIGDGRTVPYWAAGHDRLVLVDAKKPLEYVSVYEEELGKLLEDTC